MAYLSKELAGNGGKSEEMAMDTSWTAEVASQECLEKFRTESQSPRLYPKWQAFLNRHPGRRRAHAALLQRESQGEMKGQNITTTAIDPKMQWNKEQPSVLVFDVNETLIDFESLNGCDRVLMSYIDAGRANPY